jgi:hypothetical protein
VSLQPRLKTLEELHPPSLYGWTTHPTLNRIVPECDEDALTAIFNRRQPRNLPSERRSPYVKVQFAVDFIHGGFESCEAHLRDDLAKSVD